MNHATDTMTQDVIQVLRCFQQREYSGPMHAHTRFFGDLGFSSIDAVILGETLDERYGKKLPFGSFLRELRDRGAEDIAIGDLADFLCRHVTPRES